MSFFGDSKGIRLTASAKRASVQPVAGREAKRKTGVRSLKEIGHRKVPEIDWMVTPRGFEPLLQP